jgi:hypothetical protein
MSFIKKLGRTLMGGKGSREFLREQVLKEMGPQLTELFNKAENAISENNRMKAMEYLAKLRKELLG